MCVEAKYVKRHFKPITTRATELLGLIDIDLAGFRNMVRRGGKRYYITFI